MKQYFGIKAKYPDALLLFRVGDFYETFSEDAIKTAQVLGIVLTQRKNGAASHVELAGFPHHSLDTYLPKLVRAGYRVAICDQLEDPKLTKNIVKRGVTELVTPGVSYNDQVLDHKSNNFLAAIHFYQNQAGLALLDISTGEFMAAEGSLPYIEKLMQGFKPSEVLFQRNFENRFLDMFGGKYHTFRLEDWVFTRDFAYDILLSHFKTKSLKGFGVEDMLSGTIAAGAVLHYLRETHHEKLSHVAGLSRVDEDNYVWLDRFTIRNLELLQPAHDGAVSLLHVIDRTISPMGSRLLKRWTVLPLKQLKPIVQRHEAVKYFIENKEVSKEVASHIEKIGDVERLISKVAVGRIQPREVLQLHRALNAMRPIQSLVAASGNVLLQQIAEQLNPCKSVIDRIGKELDPEAPAQIIKGGVIAKGVSPELDGLRDITTRGKERLLEIQQREIKVTGISSLKIAFNNVFGYYIEVRNTHKDKVPGAWMRKQTLVNAERYITEELKEYEHKILGAEEKILDLESKLYIELVDALARYIEPIQLNARRIAELDCLLGFARIAEENNYCCPVMTEDHTLNIHEGRHPVIEKQLPTGEAYISNDVYLDNIKQQIMMITGPNMAGKSALLRQTALIVIMAQMGSFVPATSAHIGMIDKVFTRVGASDNISSGESTFMVEMNETASILNNLSSRSLVLLDEIGRGTSTYDGVSIAWAIAEYIHERKDARAKTLFATHYHELNDMASTFKRIKNFNVSVKEVSDKVIFLRKLKPGGSEHSFGIHVAQMAGMPPSVVGRAKQIMGRLEKSHAGGMVDVPAGKRQDDPLQLSFFQLDDPVLQQIRDEISLMDINSLTPVEALMKLNEIKKISGK
jgi:DNA mismatch repair protein MutS